MPTPSLLIVPARFKTGTLYSQIPVPVAPSTSSVGDFTVTRNTAARRFDSAGLIASVASGIPRLDYYTSGGVTGCPALLVEPAGTNLALQSEGLSVSGTWSISNSTQVTANTTGTTDPAGSTLSDLIFCQASGTAAQGVNQSITIATSGTYTMSVFVKKANNFDWFRIQFQDPAAAVHQVYYNLVSGTLGAVDAGSTGTITNFGNGWYRLTHSRSVAAGSIGFGLRLANANSTLTVPCDGISGAYIWGAQFEAGSVATSYIPTTTGTGSRSADVISVSGAVSGSIGQQSGTLYIECQSEFASNDIIVINTAGQMPGNNYLSITKTSLNRFSAAVVASGTLVSFTETSGITSFAKIAIAYASGNTACFINGVQVGSTSATGFSFNGALNNIRFIADLIVGTRPTRIRALALYNTRLTDGELATLTTP